MRSKKRSFLMSLTSLILCVAMLVGSTFAWFTDTVTSSRNQIIAGNLDVELYHSANSATVEKTDSNKVDKNTKLFEVALWEPGVVSVENFKIANVGTLAFKYKMILNAWNFNKTSDGKDLRDVIKIAAINPGSFDFTGTPEEKRARAHALFTSGEAVDYSFAAFEKTGTLYPVGKAPEGQASETDFAVILYWDPTDVDNNYNMSNGKATSDGKPLFLEVGIDLVASQLEHEYDSFDNTYDANSTLPQLPERLNGNAKSGGIRKATGDQSSSMVTVTLPGASEISTDETEQVTIEVKKEVGSETKTVIGANVPAPAAIGVMDVMFVEDKGFVTPTEGKNVDDVLVMTLNVKTMEANVGSIKVDVSMMAEATRTIKTSEDDNVPVVEKRSENVTELTEPVTVVLQLDRNLTDVAVTHTHGTEAPTSFVSVDGVDDVENGKFFYAKDTGKLTLKTDKFSEFDVQFTRVEVARIGNEGFTSLQDAFDAAKEGDTIEVMKTSEDPVELSVNKNVKLNLQALDVANVTVDQGAKVTLTGKGELVADVAGELNIVGGSYEELEFKGSGNVNLVVVTTEKLVTAEGANIELSVKGGLVKNTEFAGKVILIVESGKFENFDIKQNENVEVKFNGGEFHLETEEKKAAFKADLKTSQLLYSIGDGWYVVVPCSYSPKDAEYHNLRYTVGGVSHIEELAHSFEDGVCTKCGFSSKIGKVQIHTSEPEDYVCITDGGMTNKEGVSVSQILGGAIEYDANTKTLKLMADVSVGQIDFTCKKDEECGCILDLNGHVLTCSTWSAIDVYANATAEAPYGYEGYNLVINDSRPDVSHAGAIYKVDKVMALGKYSNNYMWLSDDIARDDNGKVTDSRFPFETTVKEKIADYPIYGGIITNTHASKYAIPSDPYDGGGISTCGNTTVTFNAGTIAGIAADCDVAGIAMSRLQSGQNCKLYMNEGSAIVGCSAAIGGVRMYGTGYFELNGGRISYCHGWEYSGAVMTEESSRFVMNSGSIDHCFGEDSESAVCECNGGRVEILGGTIDSCDGGVVLFFVWDGGLTLENVTIKNCNSNAVTCYQTNCPTIVGKGANFVNNAFEWKELFDQNNRPTYINGGDFTGVPDEYTDIFGNAAGVVISGGKFTVGRSAFVNDHLAEGSAVIDNGDGTITVQ